jgi:hypothetical protein
LSGTLKIEIATSTVFRNIEFYTLAGKFNYDTENINWPNVLLESPSPWPIIRPDKAPLDSLSDNVSKLATCLCPTRAIHIGSRTADTYLYISEKENAKSTILRHC